MSLISSIHVFSVISLACFGFLFYNGFTSSQLNDYPYFYFSGNTAGMHKIYGLEFIYTCCPQYGCLIVSESPTFIY